MRCGVPAGKLGDSGGATGKGGSGTPPMGEDARMGEGGRAGVAGGRAGGLTAAAEDDVGMSAGSRIGAVPGLGGSTCGGVGKILSRPRHGLGGPLPPCVSGVVPLRPGSSAGSAGIEVASESAVLGSADVERSFRHGLEHTRALRLVQGQGFPSARVF